VNSLNAVQTDDPVKFTAVSPDLVDSCWDRAMPIIHKACEVSNGRFTASSVKKQIDMGIQILWVLYRGDDEMLLVLTTGISDYPDRKLLSVIFCASNGEGTYWLRQREKIVSALVEWAKLQKCSGIELSGRSGWERVLSPFGFKKAYVTLEMEV